MIHFDSKREAQYWVELRLRERAGDIRNLERQKKFEFIEADRVVFRYMADFVYFEGEQRRIVDVKGYDTKLSALKRKLIEARYNVTIEVVK